MGIAELPGEHVDVLEEWQSQTSWKLLILSSHLVLWISSIWLFLSYILL